MKVTKRKRKEQRRISIQASRVQQLEDAVLDMPPVKFPVKSHFTNNNDGMDIYCREFFVPAGSVLTGIVYKIEAFMVLAKGKMRIIDGNGYKDIEAPCLLKNKVGTKNGAYAYEDCTFFSFTPNPNNERDLIKILSICSATDPKKIQGMGENEQELRHKRRLEHVETV